MSKKTKETEDNFEKFMNILHAMVEPFGIDQDQNVMNQIELLQESVNRKVFNENNPITPQKKVHEDRKKFIAIFKQRYLELSDLIYERTITGIEGKMINAANKLLKEHSFDSDDFLKWVFEEFLPNNERFGLVTIKQVCGQFFTHEFIYRYKDVADDKKKENLQELEAQDLANRARTLIRSGELSKEESDDMKKIGKDYREGDIMITVLRKTVEELEAKHRHK